MKKRHHYSPAEIKDTIKRQAAEHTHEAVGKATRQLVPDIYAAIALAIMKDPEDERSVEERSEYVSRIFTSSQEIWINASRSSKVRSFRLILKELKESYGIVVKGMD